MIQNISYTVGLGSSDHSCIQLYLNYAATRSERNITGYNVGGANFDQMKDMLQEVDWDKKLKDLNVTETWETITGLINKAIDTCIPKSNQPLKKNHIYSVLESKGPKTQI